MLAPSLPRLVPQRDTFNCQFAGSRSFPLRSVLIHTASPPTLRQGLDCHTARDVEYRYRKRAPFTNDQPGHCTSSVKQHAPRSLSCCRASLSCIAFCLRSLIYNTYNDCEARVCWSTGRAVCTERRNAKKWCGCAKSNDGRVAVAGKKKQFARVFGAV